MKSARKAPPQREMWGEKAQPPAGMNSEKNCVWNPNRPRVWAPPGFVDPYAEENALADMLADVAPLYVKDEILVYLDEGKLRPVSADVLREIVGKFIKLPKLTNHGSESEPDWICELVAYEASPEMLEALLDTERAWHEGALSSRVPQVA